MTFRYFTPKPPVDAVVPWDGTNLTEIQGALSNYGWNVTSSGGTLSISIDPWNTWTASIGDWIIPGRPPIATADIPEYLASRQEVAADSATYTIAQ